MPRPISASTPRAAFALHGQRRPSWRSLSPAAIDRRHRLQLFHAALRASLLACGLLVAPAACLRCSMPRPSAASTPHAAHALHGQRLPSWRPLSPAAIDRRRRLQLCHAALRACMLACGLLVAPAACLRCSVPCPIAASTPPAAFALHGQRLPSWRSLSPTAIDRRRRLQLFHAALRASPLACGPLLAPAACLRCSMPRPSAASTPQAAYALYGQRLPSWRSIPPAAIDGRRRLQL